jgi:hypothetical protein
MTMVGQNCIHTIYPVYDRIFGSFPAKNTVHTPRLVLANPTYSVRLYKVPKAAFPIDVKLCFCEQMYKLSP